MSQQHPDIPIGTYRLQFNQGFTFRDARKIVPYLHALGVSHVYSSPFFQARADSTHGYDICDHNRLNAAVGSREDFEAFIAALHERGMGQIADFVPNHMGIGEAINTWWMDVLENGPSSPFARYFDIDWEPIKEELESQVLLPILGDQYGRVLENGEFRLRFCEGAFALHYYDHVLPLTPRSYNRILELAVERLDAQYGQEDFFSELRSIMTAIEHLPGRLETSPERVEERAREKEVVKRRLLRLCEECPQVLEAIEQALFQLQGKVGDPRSFDAMDALIEAQPYRLSYWKTAAEEINYRRFFDINDLAAIRVELAEVFEATHAMLFDLIRKGAVNGLRIDHVDGLLDPAGYLEKLQERYREAFLLSGDEDGLYLLVEKILVEGERLRPDWPVHGTTGYDFLNDVLRVIIDPSAERHITSTYHKFIEERVRFDDLVYEQKQKVMRLSLASEINVLAYSLNRLSEKNRWYRDFTLNSLTTVVREVIACFPVYRTYIMPDREVDDVDRGVLTRAVNAARRRNPGIERSIFDFLREILLMKFPANIDEADREEHVRFVLKFQQCTGPIMAKGLEDTAFYIYNRLAALNEVGGEPQAFGAAPEGFHQAVAERSRVYPHSMLATSTHDTKRSEDVRARMAAISEMPDQWRKALQKWRAANRRHRREVDGDIAPDHNEEYLLYQTLLGSWPIGGLEADPDYVVRIQDYMTKAIKEAKVNSSWIQPNEAWDEAVRDFVAAILKPGSRNRFLGEFVPLATRISETGVINSLTQLVLKCTVPGVPDFYQGNELWDLSLVDPDNRRPVDYESRRKAMKSLEKSADPAALLKNWPDGRIKMFMTRSLLLLRSTARGLFLYGDYQPMSVAGPHAERCLAFRREYNGTKLVVIVPRLSSRLGFPPVGDVWENTSLAWLADDSEEWTNLFTGETRGMIGGPVPVADLLSEFPFAVLTCK